MEKKRTKRILSAFLASIMILTIMPFTIFASESDPLVWEEVMTDNPLERLRNRVRGEFRGHGRLDFPLEQLEILMYIDPFFYLIPDAQIYATTTLTDDFEDNAVILVLNHSISRDNRDFTLEDFGDINALYIKDLDRLSSEEYNYAEALWEAERDLVLAENFSAFSLDSEESLRHLQMNYLEIREEAEENTLVNFDEYRRILLIRLDQNSKENVLRVIRQLEQRDDVYWVGPSYIPIPESTAPVTPNDPRFRDQWALQNLQLPQAWGITTRRPTTVVRVGIVGHGIDANHPDLRGRVSRLSCGSFTTSTTFGTMQAGIIGAMGNDRFGIAGISWNVHLVSVGVYGSQGTAGNHAAGIANARHMGIPILTRSFYHFPNDISLQTSVRNFTGLFVNSAGNDNQNTDQNPRFANMPRVLIVGASNMNDGRSVWNSTGTSASNYGRNSVHLFAPGGGLINGVARDILTTEPSNLFDYYNGTSAAAPHVAGVAALMLSLNPSIPPAHLRSMILDSVDPFTVFATRSVSGGRLNAYNAVRAVTGSQWESINGRWFYLIGGLRQTSWLRSGSRWYFLNPTSGVSGHLSSLPRGAMRTGWVQDNGHFFLNPRAGQMGHDASIPYGAMHSGWTQIGSQWFYLNHSSGNANHHSNFQVGQRLFNTTHTINGERFTFNASGVCTVGRGC